MTATSKKRDSPIGGMETLYDQKKLPDLGLATRMCSVAVDYEKNPDKLDQISAMLKKGGE